MARKLAAEMLSMLLSGKGHDTRMALDGAAALDVAAAFRPHVGLLDLSLPGISGYELAERLRAMPGLSGIRLVAVTGHGSDAHRARARAAGFDEHLLKPVDLEVMEMLDKAAVSYRLVLTKSDKIKASELAAVRSRTEEEARKHPAAHPEIIATSSEKGGGIPELRAAVLEAVLA